MLIRSYVVRFDGGFAPNPFGGYLTLATCKPRIRKHAQAGDLIVGTGSTNSVGATRMIYAGIVSQVVSLEEYGALEEFKNKKPFINKKTGRDLETTSTSRITANGLNEQTASILQRPKPTT